MPMQRDSADLFTIYFFEQGSTTVQDISARDFRLDLYQNGACLSLTMGDGLSFATDGTDGALEVTISDARVNQFCVGVVNFRLFDLSDTYPVCTHNGSDTLEGRAYDA